MRYRPVVLLHVVLLSVLSVAQTAPAKKSKAPADPLAGFDSFMSQVMKDWKGRGVGVGVVNDGKIVFTRGFGVRDEEKNLPVTAKTVMPIGSITKSFTVAGVAAMVDDGKLAWDEPVREFMPEFRLHDDFATDRVTPRDLVTHRTGLPRHDVMWYNNSFTRAEIISRLRHLPPSKDLRTRFQYNNLMFMTAGYLTGKVVGSSWEDAMRKQVFEPLRMVNSSLTIADLEKNGDHSLGYQEGKEGGQRVVKRIPYRVIDEAGPAGSINASIEDLTNYMLMHINDGQFDGKQVLSAANVAEMQTPQMVTPQPVRWREVGHTQYGMGWFITTYRGYKMVNHGGNIDGFSALVAFIPEKKIGAAVLANMDGTAIPQIVAYQVFDRLLGLEPVDWNKRLLEFRDKGRAAEDTAEKEGISPRKTGTKPAHPLDDYAGEYEHPGYGTLVVKRNGDGFDLKYGELGSTLKHFHYETFEVPPNEFDPLEKLKLTFITDASGDVVAARGPFEPMIEEIEFKRKAAKLTPEQLQGFVGSYDLGPNEIKVSLQGAGTLMMSVPGQPLFELVPVRGGLFDIEQLSGYRVEFKGDQIVFYQPNGTFLGTKRK